MDWLRRVVGGPICPGPSRDALILGVTGLHGRYQFVVVLELGGEFLQFRTLGYHACPVGHPSQSPVLKILAELNQRLRFIKFAWDPSDGEIVAYGDTWVCDGDLTEKQFEGHRQLEGNLL
ncbi:YbjN domain-containing protein [Gemmatimonadota bacterium]